LRNSFSYIGNFHIGNFLEKPKVLDRFRLLVLVLLLVLLLQPLQTLVMRAAGQKHSIIKEVAKECNSTITDNTEIEALGISPLFGELDSLDPQAVSVNSPANKASRTPAVVGLSLKGIIAGNGGSGALAIINITGGGGADAVFSKGDQLPDAAILKEIYFDRVVISRGEVDSVLLLGGDDNQQGPVLSVAKKRREQTAPVHPKAVRAEPYQKEIPRILLASKLANPAKLMREITVQPYKKDGIQQGYRLISVRGSSLLRKLGLNSGDVITEVNDLKLNNLRNSLNALNQIKNAEVLRVSALRRGKNKSFVYTINK